MDCVLADITRFISELGLLPARSAHAIPCCETTGHEKMFLRFAAARLEAADEVCVVLTTHEGAVFRIRGFATACAAQSWIERETKPCANAAAALKLVSIPGKRLRDRAA